MVFSCLLLLCNLKLSAQNFSKSEVLSDLDYLKHSLKMTHINLYGNTTKEAFEHNLTKVRREIKKDSFTQLEVIKYFQKVVAGVNNAHTRIPFPVPSYIQYAQSGGTLFPLEIAIEKGKALVRENWSENQTIKKGFEVVRINDLTMEAVLDSIYPLVSAERRYFKNAQIENLSLPRYYWLAFGEQPIFEVELSHDNKTEIIQLNAIRAIEDFEIRRSDILYHKPELRFYGKNIAYLRPGDFGGDLEQYKNFIDSAFTEIRAVSSKNLIIDLRNHSGGDNVFSDYLVAYIADKPFKWASRFQLKTNKLLKENTRQNRDTTLAYWKSILERKNGEVYDYDFGFCDPNPSQIRFHGKVYALVNRQSYSQSTVTAAQIQDYNFGTLVGEETAEFPNLYASIYNYSLPNTGITVDVAKGKIERVSEVDNNRGVLPDIIIKDHLLDKDDEILEGLLNKIKIQ